MKYIKNFLNLKLRRIWCRVVEVDEECSPFTKGAIWSMEYHYIPVRYLIPFWITEDREEEYIESNHGNDWLYL